VRCASSRRRSSISYAELLEQAQYQPSHTSPALSKFASIRIPQKPRHFSSRLKVTIALATRCVLNLSCSMSRGLITALHPSFTSRPMPQIVSVHIPSRKVFEVLFPPALIEILMVDPIFDKLFSWSASTTYASLLQTLNASTGKASPIFTASLDLSGNSGKHPPLTSIPFALCPCLCHGPMNDTLGVQALLWQLQTGLYTAR
jgi:hypothetical protein